MEENNTNVSEEVKDNDTKENVSDSNTQENKEKTFTQSELDEIINKRLAKEKKKRDEATEKAAADAREADKLENMSANERYEKKLADLEKKLEEKEKAEARKDLTNTTLKELSVRGIDSDFIEFVLGENAEDTKEKLDLFETKLNKMVEEKVNSQVQDRLRGKAPKTATVQTKASFTVEEIKKMSPAEINKNWEQIKNIKLN